MTRRIVALLVMVGGLAAVAPWLAPYEAEAQHRRFMSAPPMTPRIIDRGSLRAPFVYPITLADRMAQRYEQDRSQTRALPWFNDRADEPVFLLGADSLGRDVLSRLLHGARISLGVALLSAAGALLLGALIGGVAGYRGGWLDDVAMRSADFVVVLPAIYVSLVLRALMPLVLPAWTVFMLMTAIFAFMGWPFVARGIRGILVSERDREYVVAARSLGASHSRILRRHLLPACSEHLLVQATLLLPAFILGEATLSYVGLGFPEHVATWGTMLSEAGRLSAMTRFPWTLAPAAAIFLVVLSANIILRSDKIDARPV